MKTLLKKNVKQMKNNFVKVFQMNLNSICVNIRYIKYCKKLRFDEKPDYEFCKKLFKNLMY